MSATFTPVHLSGSTSGRQILVVATATPGTLIHTATAGAVNFDEITLDAQNADGSDRLLTIEFGGVASPGDVVQITIPLKSGANRVIDRWRLNGGLVIRAFAAAASQISIGGRVDRYTA